MTFDAEGQSELEQQEVDPHASRFSPRRVVAGAVALATVLATAIAGYSLYTGRDSYRAKKDLSHALALEKAGRRPDGYPLLESALRLQPENPSVYKQAGYYYLRGQQWRSGIIDLCHSLQWQPDDVTALVNLANGYMVLGQLDQAGAEFADAYKLKPKANFVLRNFATYQLLVHQYTKARDMASAALSQELNAVSQWDLVAAYGYLDNWPAVDNELENEWVSGEHQAYWQFISDMVANRIDAHSHLNAEQQAEAPGALLQLILMRQLSAVGHLLQHGDDVVSNSDWNVGRVAYARLTAGASAAERLRRALGVPSTAVNDLLSGGGDFGRVSVVAGRNVTVKSGERAPSCRSVLAASNPFIR